MESIVKMSDDDHSEGNLTIVTESPKAGKSKPGHVLLQPEEKKVIESMGKDVQEAIEMKASQSNLTTVNAKNILKHLTTNEHVLALVRKADNPDMETENIFEPTLTRAKAKEIGISLPWLEPSRSIDLQMLITEELEEDSSGDEYVLPEESEDDRDSIVVSETDIPSVSPPILLQEINWSDDGGFKISPVKSVSTAEEEANIALCTRSKVSYSATSVDVLAKAFMPPYITTDMDEMDCEDDDWRDFLNMLNQPLDEVAKPTEDEDHDPEYNILADENITEDDSEELRADKAVKISRKEYNQLMEDLCEFVDLDNNQDNTSTCPNESVPVYQYNDLSTTLQNPASFDTASTNELPTIEPACPTEYNVMMNNDQKLLLEQQMRQHVQILTRSLPTTR